MPRIGTRILKSKGYAIIFAGLLLSGCTTWQTQDPEFYPVDPAERLSLHGNLGVSHALQ